MDDNSLISLVKRGRQDAYRALVDRYQHMVYNLAYKILLDEDEAKDAAQEAFIKAYKALASFKGQSKFSTWLYRIAWTTTISKTRGKKRSTSLDEAQEYVSPEAQPDALMQESDQSYYLHQALGALSAPDRLLLTLYYLQELPMEEVAEIAGLDKNNAKVKVHRARKKLAVLLEKILPQETKELI